MVRARSFIGFPARRISFYGIAVHREMILAFLAVHQRSNLILRSLRSKRLEGWRHGNDTRPSFETALRASSG
jgi:hypothetical protein